MVVGVKKIFTWSWSFDETISKLDSMVLGGVLDVSLQKQSSDYRKKSRYATLVKRVVKKASSMDWPYKRKAVIDAHFCQKPRRHFRLEFN
jgi:hypothetical protein